MDEEQEQEASKSVFVALMREEGDATEILLVENAPKYLPNGALKPKGWGMPGGGVDGDEGEKHTAAREVLEETGYVLEQDSVTLLDYEMRGNNHMVLIVTGKIAGGRIKTTAGDDTITAAWFPINRLPSTVYNSHKKRIARALEILKENSAIEYY
ncbi:MAG: hypothetical protein UX53_C0027G0004 [Candidatus Azambacteria bacterium GW2011_GWB2_46_37]|uniref:Nudix hydrolase domain-containing protein n=7 Tax=Candidatus Azamiibacteriota TaxID=1752741 RepID=A0A1F5C902_9BACT|nr:MAG: hypothetical protein UX51_C0043G0002 [Candidatus Azambacteria bacterium GW2011_GWF2_46_32]KKU38615.1 MAG: hypothetical protein UX53_C0027G0004 [Candidatus Azambacteria bacterium GW2011_GWB2_46_37]KKU40599.1 MAG: hypothetical protein UX56_C0030G0003 [Candidatus Azambacteria bacterium GW2011_GWD2_46_48]OGD29803.1 MAG: hypothetical protein A2W60_03365 [Candidatus Azambacteria bacterium RIFCSPHIGHO2_02_46_12]OGD39313.1 MAG: hypothetical protein A3A25_02555 [Candidatus Azambacteria bacterium